MPSTALALLVSLSMIALEQRAAAREESAPTPTAVLRARPEGAVAPQPAEVQASPSAAGFFARIDVKEDWGSAPFTVKFAPVVGGADALPPYRYTWLFGDGSPPSREQSPQHVYTLAGEYWATLRVRDAAGKRASFSTEIWVDEGADRPDADASDPAQTFSVELGVDSDWGEVPHTVRFWGIPDGPGAKAPFTYTWEFGDGSPPSTEEAPIHVYQSADEFWVMLTIEALGGRKARAYRSIWVEER